MDEKDIVEYDDDHSMSVIQVYLKELNHLLPSSAAPCSKWINSRFYIHETVNIITAPRVGFLKTSVEPLGPRRWYKYDSKKSVADACYTLG